MEHRDPSSPAPMPTILRYGISILSVAIGIGLDFFLLRHFDAKLTPFLFAVAVTVWYAGTGPGVLAIVLSVLSLNYFFLQPFFSFGPISYADLVYLTFCIFCALAVGWVSAVRRGTEQELRQARDELETKVLERTANLQRSESYLAETQKLTHTGTWAWDARSQKVLFCSEEMFRIYGLDPQVDLPTRKNFRQRVHPEDRNRVDERQARVVNEKVGRFDEFRIVLPDGTVKHVSSSWHTVLDGNGELVELIGTATDITERRRAEQALRESEAKIRRLVDSNIIGIFFSGVEGRVLETNEAFLHLVGQHRDDLVSGRIRWTDLTPPEWRERDRRALAELTSNTTAQPYEKEFFRKDGSRVPVLIGGALFEEGGNEGVAFVLDLTELKRAEQALRESERSARSAFDGIAGLISILGPNGEVEVANRQFLEYFGRSLEWIKNWETNDTLHPEDLPRVAELFKRAIASGIPFNFELRLRRFDGEYRWFDTRGVPIRDDSGHIARWYNLLTDIEDRTRALARLDQMQSDLAHMNRVATMGQLTASITHEVNQPITAAITYALAARRFLGADPPNFREVGDTLSLIVKEGNRAGEVVERVRALVKKVPARKDAVAIDDAIREVIALTRAEAANNSVSVRTQFAEGLPCVQGDRVQLQQVMLNLIVNAIQAMSGIGEGARELQISIDAVPSEGGLRVGVRDTGPGLSPESLSRLFEPFYTTKPEGMGMGLSICRSIIEAHGGRLWATRCEPQGALFQFTIPAISAGGS
jgi:PAS domain S-box-containing protein